MSKSALSFSRFLVPCVCAALALLAVACTSPARQNETASISAPSASVMPFDAWQHYQLPGKQPTEFSFVHQDGRLVAAAVANASASMLRQPVRVEAADIGQIQFSWMVPQLIEQADVGVRQVDDSPVRVILAFEGDRSTFSMKNAMLSELSHTITGEPLPYATLMSVWCNKRAPDTVIINPRTDRIRTIVVESGTQGLSHWLDYKRNIRADFEKAFGEAPGPLVGLAIMTDTDNTQTKARAWFGPLQLTAVN
ncbi:MAG: DUF3047 domain-containing protein [Rhodoferax sp.]